MPLYEYECDACNHRFELIQRFSDPPVQRCPSCGGPVHKLQSAPAFQFKGTGWYITDYAKKDAAVAKADGSSPEGKGEAGPDKAGTTGEAAGAAKSGKEAGTGASAGTSTAPPSDAVSVGAAAAKKS